MAHYTSLFKSCGSSILFLVLPYPVVFLNMVYWWKLEWTPIARQTRIFNIFIKMLNTQEHSIYLHIPFCRHRCSYCDFNTYAGLENLIPAYAWALCREIQLTAESAGVALPILTVFFGGGTPSLLPLTEIERIIATLKQYFHLLPGAEITLEANPGTVSLPYLSGLSGLGVNRLSLGMQSANVTELRILEREHNFQEVLEAVAWARQAGFANLNLDLIYGIPYQTLPAWQATLNKALALQPDHFSLYALTLEHGTPMQRQVERRLIPTPDPDLAADMYDLAAERLDSAGFHQYEISNWARLSTERQPMACRHNLQYWRNQPYLGLGAGAHGYAGGYRTVNTRMPSRYIQKCREGQLQIFPRTPATAEAILIDRKAEIAETMMMGLRLVEEGVSKRAFQERFGENIEAAFGDAIARLCSLGLLEWGGSERDSLRLSKRGRLLGNQVFMEFV